MVSERPPASDETAMLDQSLNEVVERLTAARPSERTRELLFEAKRLKAVLTTWHAIGPTPEALAAMLSRVVELSTALRMLSYPPDE